MARRVARSMREARVLRQAEFDDERVPDPLGILTRLEGVGGRAGAQTGQDQVVQQCLRVARIEPLREGGAELRPLHTQRMCARFSTSSAGTPTCPATSPEQSGEVCRLPDFFTAKRRSAARPDFTRAKSESPVPGWTFPEQSGEVCRPPDFRRAKSESVPGGGSGRRVGVPARAAKNRPPGEKNRVFSRPLRACIRKRGLLFRKKNR